MEKKLKIKMIICKYLPHFYKKYDWSEKEKESHWRLIPVIWESWKDMLESKIS